MPTWFRWPAATAIMTRRWRARDAQGKLLAVGRWMPAGSFHNLIDN